MRMGRIYNNSLTNSTLLQQTSISNFFNIFSHLIAFECKPAHMNILQIILLMQTATQNSMRLGKVFHQSKT